MNIHVERSRHRSTDIYDGISRIGGLGQWADGSVMIYLERLVFSKEELRAIADALELEEKHLSQFKEKS